MCRNVKNPIFRRIGLKLHNSPTRVYSWGICLSRGPPPDLSMKDVIVNLPQMDRKLKSQGNLCQNRYAIVSAGVLRSVIYDQSESLNALRLKRACFMIDIRCESLDARINRRYNVALNKASAALGGSAGECWKARTAGKL